MEKAFQPDLQYDPSIATKGFLMIKKSRSTNDTAIGWHYVACCLVVAMTCKTALADEERKNRGADPFFQISSAIANCPVPLGPLVTEQEWKKESHHRVERGNSCWQDGRCRLSNSYLYDAEIAQSVMHRLNDISRIDAALQWRKETTLWLTLQHRHIFVQGCVSVDFDRQRFLSELLRTADVEKVVDQTTIDLNPASSPYSLAAPSASN